MITVKARDWTPLGRLLRTEDAWARLCADVSHCDPRPMRDAWMDQKTVVVR